jgi:hypothetical protein
MRRSVYMLLLHLPVAAVISQPQDESLIAHFTFEEDFSGGMLLDGSGQGNHAYAVPRFGSITNWPEVATGVDGGTAGLFDYYYDGWSLGRSGDYAAVSYLAPFRNLTNATVAVWIHYHAAPGGNYLADANATAISAGYAVTGAWDLGRSSSDYTEVSFFTNNTASAAVTLTFPDRSYQTGGDSGGWHHYAFTFSQGTVRTYYDGLPWREAVVPLDRLTVARYFLGIGCKTHNGDPLLEEGIDIYPNHGWLNGRLDDIRIYDRALSAAEIVTVFHALDQESPSAPEAVWARAAATTQVELRWGAAQDDFRVVGYTIRDHGEVVATVAELCLVHSGLEPGSDHQYTVEAFDGAGNLSAPSAPVWVSLPSDPDPVEVVVDDNDGRPWISAVGEWYRTSYPAGYWGIGFRTDGNSGKGAKSLSYHPYLPEAGVYEVFIRYAQRSTYASNVPVEIVYDGGTDNVTLNQRVDGGQWNLLGTYSFAMGSSARVTLRTAGTSGYVAADALRFLKPGAPRSIITVSATDATAGEPGTLQGTGTLAFSRTAPTTSALTVDFTVGGTAAGGSDYSSIGTAVTFLAGSATATKTVSVLDDSLVESDETVVVTLASGSGYTIGNPSSAVVTILDDDVTGGEIVLDDPVATYVGTWSLSTTVAGYHGSGYRHDGNSGKGSKSAMFRPSLATAGGYRVYLWYSANGNRAGNVPVDVIHAGGTATVTVDQRVNGGQWNLLGTYSFNVGTGGYVRIRNGGTTGYVAADAVKWVPAAETDIVMDDLAATYVGTWSLSTAVAGYHGNGYRHDGNTGKGSKSAMFRPSLSTAGGYRVYLWYSANGNRAGNVPVDVIHAGGTATLSVDQRVNGGQWNLLGTYSFNAGTGGYVRIRNGGARGYVAADAVKWVPASETDIVVYDPRATFEETLPLNTSGEYITQRPLLLALTEGEDGQLVPP